MRASLIREITVIQSTRAEVRGIGRDREATASMHIKQIIINGFRSFRSQAEVEPFR